MKSQNPLISIGIPVYNGEKYIYQSVQSILRQTYSRLEIIISDNNSEDNTLKICNDLAKHDKRIRLYTQPQQITGISNFNFVLKKAKGTYFMWQAADDLRGEKTIEILNNLFQNYPDAVLAMSDYKNIYRNRKYFVNKPLVYNNEITKKDSLKYFIQHKKIASLYGLFKTGILKKTGGYHADSRPFYKGSDYVTIFRCLLHGKVVYTSEILFLKRETGYFTKRYNVISGKIFFNTDIQKRIRRYLFSPVYFMYDALFSLLFLWESKWSISDKIKITGFIVISVLLDFFRFLFSVAHGIYIFLKNTFKI